MEFTVQSHTELLVRDGFPQISIGDAFRLPPEEPSDLVIRNAVASLHLELTETLNDIVIRLPSTTYDSAKFNAVSVKRTRPAPHTALVMSNGDMCITGCKSAEDLDHAFRGLIKEIYPAMDTDATDALMMLVNVQNVVCTASIGRHLDLTTLAASYPDRATYDANAFSGVIFRIVLPINIARSSGMVRIAPAQAPRVVDLESEAAAGAVAEDFTPPVTALIFRSGKIIFTGGRTVNACHAALQLLTPLLTAFMM
jgi:TATA-box binding protein (TBP) (component of TFIID and TFIIIB)